MTEKATNDPARLTPNDHGKALGSATPLSSSGSGEGVAAPQDLGLSIDMFDVDRLRSWAHHFEEFGSDVTHWGSLPFVVKKLGLIADNVEKAIHDIGQLRASLSEQDEALTALKSEWQPIETAPKDGRMLLLYPSSNWTDDTEFDYEVSYWDEDSGSFHQRGHPDDFEGFTHWMPLPAPPATNAGATKREAHQAESAQSLSSSLVTPCANCGKVHDGGPRGPEVTPRTPETP